MNLKKMLIIFILLGMVLPGCAQKPVLSAEKLALDLSYPVAWIDAPLDGSRIPLAPYELVFHLADPTGLKAGEVAINGSVIATVPVDSAGMTLATIKQSWSPEQPGEYEIKARAQNQSGSWSQPVIVHVYVGDLSTETPTFTLTPQITISPSVTPTFTFTNTPSPSPTSTPTLTPTIGEMVFIPSASEHSIKVGSCSPNQTVIEVQITPSDAIKYVYLFAHLKDQSSDETTKWNDGFAMQSTSTPGVYRYTLKTSSLEDNRKFSSSYLWYQFVATDKKNTNIGRSKVIGDIVVSLCGRDPVIAFSPMPIITGIKFPTSTPIVK